MEPPGDESCLRGVLRVCELEAEEGSATRRVLSGDAAAVSLRDLAHDRETQAGTRERAGRRRAIEAVEHVTPVLCCDPRAVIAHTQLAPGQRDVDARARCRPFAGVLEQVP